MPAIPSWASLGVMTFEVLVEGTQIPDTYMVKSITSIKEINRISFAEVVISESTDENENKFKASQDDIFKPGKEIEIKAGYDNNNEIIFKGIIIKHGLKIRKNGNAFLKIECRDKAIKMTVNKKSNYYYESKDSDIIDFLIGNHGLESDIEETKVEHKELVQFHSTDWDFLMIRAEVNGLISIVDDGLIQLNKPDLNQSPELELALGNMIRDFEATVDCRFQYKSVVAQAWDFGANEILITEAKEPSFETAGNFDSQDLAEVIGEKEFNLSHGGRANESELQAWADAKLERNRMAKVQGRVSIQGVSNIKHGQVIKLDGLSERFNGNNFVCGVRHHLENGDWQTDLQLGFNPEWFAETYEVNQQEASGRFPAIHGLQIGIVSQLVDDPDTENRILVQLPIINAQEQGIWARVSTLDAGENRGSFFLPEVGDEVIVGFINGDPKEAIVLGMLNSSTRPAPVSATDENHEKGFFTRSEMKIHFNDEEESIIIANKKENQIEILKESVIIKDSNNNVITMDSDGIKISSGSDLILEATGDVKIEAGGNIEQNASLNFKAEGGAGAELSTGAIAVLKGSLVQIN